MPAGYKVTKLGVLPEEWKATTFGEVMTGFSSGATPYRANKHYYVGDINWVTSGELNYNLISQTIEHISKEAQKRTNLKLLPEGTFLMAITGLEAAGTRGSCAILGVEATTNQSCMALFPTKELTTQYLFYYYVLYGDALAFQFCQGTKQQSYTGSIVKRLPIALPPVSEQKLITKALGEMDALLAAQRARLAKQRAVKQGLLQGLLSGEMRLPGFAGEWEVRALNVEIEALNSGISVNSETNDGMSTGYENCILKTSCVANGVFKPWEAKTIVARDLGRAKLNPKAGSIIISRMNTPDLVGESGYVDKDYPHLFVPDRLWQTKFFARSKVNTRWLAFVFAGKEIRTKLRESATGTSGSMKNLSKPAFLSILVAFPSPDEQRAIADVLTEADAHLAALEAEHAKTQLLKQGMMQNLLTGKIRLV